MLELFSFIIFHEDLKKRDQAYCKPFIKIEEICVKKNGYGNQYMVVVIIELKGCCFKNVFLIIERFVTEAKKLCYKQCEF